MRKEYDTKNYLKKSFQPEKSLLDAQQTAGKLLITLAFLKLRLPSLSVAQTEWMFHLMLVFLKILIDTKLLSCKKSEFLDLRYQK